MNIPSNPMMSELRRHGDLLDMLASRYENLGELVGVFSCSGELDFKECKAACAIVDLADRLTDEAKNLAADFWSIIRPQETSAAGNN